MADNFLEVRHVDKAYEGVQALSDVSLAVERGKVHCLVGENGSGKSTLIKVIGGVVDADRGEVVIGGRVHAHLQAIEAIREGIQIIYQDLSLYPNLSVAENISLNQMIETRVMLTGRSQMRALARRELEEIGETVDLDELVQNLSVAKKQMVAITRTLTQGAKLIIMDEPTSAITREEVDHLFSVIAGLKARGISILFVSHKLSEVFEIAERVTVLRDGRKVGDYAASELDDARLTLLMTGRTVSSVPYRYEAGGRSAAPVLEVAGLSKSKQFEEVSFQLWPGEILGITGLVGSGTTEIGLCLFGLNRPDRGTIRIDGRAVDVDSPEEAQKLGIAYLPEDRLSEGLFIGRAIGDNIVVTVLRHLLSRLRLIDPGRRRRLEADWITQLRIKTPSPRAPASGLSGGNQQRVVLAKWLATEPRVFILDGPTVGIDIGSKSTIHEIIRDLARRGMAIIMISGEIPEVLQNCNRILVMRKGRIEREIARPEEITEKELLDIATAKSATAAAP